MKWAHILTHVGLHVGARVAEYLSPPSHGGGGGGGGGGVAGWTGRGRGGWVPGSNGVAWTGVPIDRIDSFKSAEPDSMVAAIFFAVVSRDRPDLLPVLMDEYADAQALFPGLLIYVKGL